MCHSKLIINKLILTTSLFVFTLSGFFLNLNILFSFLLVSLSKVSSLTLCIHYTTKVVYAKTGEIVLATYTKLCNNYADRAKFIYNGLTKNKLTHLELSKNTVAIEENNILSIDGVSYFNCEKDLAFTVVDTDRKLKLFELTDLFPDAKSMSGMVKEVRATLA